MPARA